VSIAADEGYRKQKSIPSPPIFVQRKKDQRQTEAEKNTANSVSFLHRNGAESHTHRSR
jgi:hypothetical protein